MSLGFGFYEKDTKFLDYVGNEGTVIKHNGGGWHDVKINYPSGTKLLKLRTNAIIPKGLRISRVSKVALAKYAKTPKVVKIKLSKRKAKAKAKLSKKRVPLRRGPTLSPKTTLIQPVRNFECNKAFFKECFNKLSNVKVLYEVGRGSFGIVYKCTAELNTKYDIMYTGPVRRNSTVFPKPKLVDVALKVIYLEDKADMFKEIEFSYYMGEIGIGPVIYDAFYHKDVKNRYIQYIGMEYFEYSGQSALDLGLTKNQGDRIVSEMIRLLHKQIFEYNLFCVDVKPGNYVVNLNDNKEQDGVKVRMIDYGFDFCKFDSVLETEKTMSFETKVIVFYLIELLQLYFFIADFQNIRCKLFLPMFYQDPYFRNMKIYFEDMKKCFPLVPQFYHYHGKKLGAIEKIIVNIDKNIF